MNYAQDAGPVDLGVVLPQHVIGDDPLAPVQPVKVHRRLHSPQNLTKQEISPVILFETIHEERKDKKTLVAFKAGFRIRIRMDMH